MRESHIQSYEVHEEARGSWPQEKQLPGFRWVPACCLPWLALDTQCGGDMGHVCIN